MTETKDLHPVAESSLDFPSQAPSSIASKAELRRWVQARLSAAPIGRSDSNAKRLHELQSRIEKLLALHPGPWLGYRAKANEVALPESASFAVPRVVGDQLEFWVGGKSFVLSQFGVEEPDLKDSTWRPVDLLNVVGVMVPGIAFDVLGQRLGRGGGFYDRFLSDLLAKTSAGSRPLLVGIGWAEQLIDRVPTEEHDVTLDGVMTDRPTIWRFATTRPAKTGVEFSGKKVER